MGNRSTIFKKILLSLILIILFLHGIQGFINFVETPPLKGYIEKPKKPNLSKSSWLDGNYQIKEEEYINSRFGFRSFYIRLSNQIAFSLFKKAKANGVIIGQENYLYEENYLKAHSGKDYLGMDRLQKLSERIKFISDTLTKLNKQLLIVFAAGKGSYYPEFFPSQYKQITEKTNYKVLSNQLKKINVPVIDFNKWFIERKTKTKYPLYPQYGIHWSNYGAVLAADSIIKEIEYLQKIDMPNIIFDNIKLRQPEGNDYDIADGMNLLQKLKSFEMAYPEIKTENSKNKIRPSVLVISDSFYWGMYGFGIANSFQNDHFWYYNKQVYPETFKEELFTEDLNFGKEIDKHDVFIVMATEATLPNLGWGFLENAEMFFKGVHLKNDNDYKQQIKQLKKVIKGDKNWVIQINEKALKREITFDSMLTIDAIWLLNKNNSKNNN